MVFVLVSVDLRLSPTIASGLCCCALTSKALTSVCSLSYDELESGCGDWQTDTLSDELALDADVLNTDVFVGSPGVDDAVGAEVIG